MWLLLSCSAEDLKFDTAEDSKVSAEGIQTLFFSTPYDDAGQPSGLWRTAHLQGNELSLAQEYELGRVTSGQMRFFGTYGIVALDDGSISSVRVQNGVVQPLEIQRDLGIYASAVWPGQSGFVWVVDENWPENGGGLYRCEIDIDGFLYAPELMVPSKNGFDLLPLGQGWVYAAREVDGQYGHLHFLNGDGSLDRSVDVFGDDESIFSAMALNGGAVYLADNAEFSTQPNRVARYVLETEEISQVQVLDPVALIEGQFAGEMLIVSGYGNAVYLWGQQINEISYQGEGPQLPTSAVRSSNSPGQGIIYLTENQGVRAISATGISDQGLVLNGSGPSWISGAIGITPVE